MPRITTCHCHQIVHPAIVKHLSSAELYLPLGVPRETCSPHCPLVQWCCGRWWISQSTSGSRHGEVCNSISPFSNTFHMKTTRNGANTNHIITTLLRRDTHITSQTGGWKHKVISSQSNLWQSPSDKSSRCTGSLCQDSSISQFLTITWHSNDGDRPPSPGTQMGQWSRAGEGSWEILHSQDLSQVPHTERPGPGHFSSLICS